MNTMERVWRRAKQVRSIKIGPVAIRYQLIRHRHVSSNFIRRLRSLFTLANASKTDRSISHTQGSIASETEQTGQENMVQKQVALIVGVGPGLGHSIVRKLAREGFRVAFASRNAKALDPLVNELRAEGFDIEAYGCDATNEQSVKSLFAYVSRDMGVPSLVVYSAQYFSRGSVVEMELPAFEDAWRNNCLGGFLVARKACRYMLPIQKGTIVLVGSTSSLIGREDHLNLAVGKFGLRALSQVLAREVWPQGIHVAHLVIDADINETNQYSESLPQANPDDIAEQILYIHQQPESCWSSELDVRPSREKFWEHC